MVAVLFAFAGSVLVASVLAPATGCSKPSECSCPSGGDDPTEVVTRCDLPVARATVSPPCVGASEDGGASIQLNELPYAGIFLVTPNALGTCHLAVTFSNGFVYAKDLTIRQELLPCGSDPSGCGSRLSVADGYLQIDRCGNAPLYPTDAQLCATGTYYAGACPSNACPPGVQLDTAYAPEGVCCICESHDASPD